MFDMKLVLSPKFLVGAAVGSMLGMRAGRDRYDKIMSKVNNTKEQLTT
jgi:hypothetical protein